MSYKCVNCSIDYDLRCPDGIGCILSHKCAYCGKEVLLYIPKFKLQKLNINFSENVEKDDESNILRKICKDS